MTQDGMTLSYNFKDLHDSYHQSLNNLKVDMMKWIEMIIFFSMW